MRCFSSSICPTNDSTSFDRVSARKFVSALLTKSKILVDFSLKKSKISCSIGPSIRNASNSSPTAVIVRFSSFFFFNYDKKYFQPDKSQQSNSFMDTIKRWFTGGSSLTPYEDFIPLSQNDNLYSANVNGFGRNCCIFLIFQISVRFPAELTGKYYLIYHNCFKYKEHGYRSLIIIVVVYF